MIRAPEYDAPRLTRGNGTRTAQGKKAPDAEHRRRRGTRELNEELSRYYRLPANQEEWRRPELVVKGEHDCDRSEPQRFAYPCSLLVLKDVEDFVAPPAQPPV